MTHRPNQVLAVVAALVVAMAAVAIVLTVNRPSPVFGTDTAEGTAQSYVQAVMNADAAAIADLVEPPPDCSPDYRLEPVDSMMRLVSSQTTGDAAVVTIEITSYTSRLLDTWTHRETFDLARTDSGWRITGNPWPYFGCD